MDTLASRHRDRVSDRQMDRGAHWLPRQLRRAAPQRRQYGELRLLPSCPHCQGALGCTHVRRFGRFGTEASRVLFRRNAHVDRKSRRPWRPRHGIDSVDRHRFQIADGRLRATPSNRSGYRRGRCAVPGRGNRGVGQHWRGRSSAGNQRALQGVWPVVPR